MVSRTGLILVVPHPRSLVCNSLGMMISTFLRVLSCALLLACSYSTPIKEINSGGPIHQLEEFIDGEIVCTGHLLEDNFEENLAAAAESKWYIPSFTNLKSVMGNDRLKRFGTRAKSKLPGPGGGIAL